VRCETERTGLISVALADLENFPKDCVWQGSTYLVGKTFESLQEMFTSTKEIQVCVNIQ
jgi:DNA-directed RNA polymerase